MRTALIVSLVALALLSGTARAEVIGADALDRCGWSEQEKRSYLQSTRRAAQGHASAEIKLRTTREREREKEEEDRRRSEASPEQFLQIKLEDEAFAPHGIPELLCSGSEEDGTWISVVVRRRPEDIARRQAIVLAAMEKARLRQPQLAAPQQGVLDTGTADPGICAESPQSAQCLIFGGVQTGVEQPAGAPIQPYPDPVYVPPPGGGGLSGGLSGGVAVAKLGGQTRHKGLPISISIDNSFPLNTYAEAVLAPGPAGRHYGRFGGMFVKASVNGQPGLFRITRLYTVAGAAEPVSLMVTLYPR